MGGKAANRETREGEHITSLTNNEVLKFWRVPPSGQELRLRRLNMYQSWGRQPDHHSQLLVALFGQFSFDLRPQLGFGRPTGFSSPYVVQMAQDFGSAAALLPYEAIRDVPANLTSFADAEMMEEFCAIDMNELRGKAFGVCFPPPGWQDRAVPLPPACREKKWGLRV